MRRHFLKVLFLLTAPMPIFWTVGLLFENELEGQLPSRTGVSKDVIAFGVLALSIFLTSVIVFAITKRRPSFFEVPAKIRAPKIVKTFVALGAISYLVIGAATFVLSSFIIGPAEDPAIDIERDLLIALSALWFPLWWIIPLSSLCEAWWLRRSVCGESRTRGS